MKSLGFVGVLVGASLCGGSSLAFAQSGSTQSTPTFATSSAASNDWSSPWQSKGYQERANARHLGIGLSLGGFIVGGRWEVANGGITSLDVVWRRAYTRSARFEVGGLLRLGFTPDAVLVSGGVPVRWVVGLDKRLEMGFGLELSYTRISFNQPIFKPSNGFTAGVRWDIGYYFDPRVAMGVTPVAFSVVTGERVDPLVTYEPSLWLRFSPI